MMTPEQATALIVAVTGLIVALGAIYQQIRSLKTRVDGRLSELLVLTRSASLAEGVMVGERAKGPTTGENLAK